MIVERFQNGDPVPVYRRFRDRGRMAPDGRVIGEYPIPGPNCGARAIIAAPDGRLFFSAHDAGAIGEVIPKAPTSR